MVFRHIQKQFLGQRVGQSPRSHSSFTHDLHCVPQGGRWGWSWGRGPCFHNHILSQRVSSFCETFSSYEEAYAPLCLWINFVLIRETFAWPLKMKYNLHTKITDHRCKVSAGGIPCFKSWIMTLAHHPTQEIEHSITPGSSLVCLSSQFPTPGRHLLFWSVITWLLDLFSN